VKQGARDKWFAETLASRGMGPGFRQDDSGTNPARNYASPSVSNIAAASASLVDLPAQTTNWKAGK
jgi:hypothetical protein